MQRGSKPGGFVATVRRTIRSRQLSYSTEKNYIHWIKRFIRYHGMKHPEKMGSDEVAEYLGYLADEKTRILVRAVKRNEDRFPTDFMFQLEDREVVALRSQIGISKKGPSKQVPSKQVPPSFLEVSYLSFPSTL